MRCGDPHRLGGEEAALEHHGGGLRTRRGEHRAVGLAVQATLAALPLAGDDGGHVRTEEVAHEAPELGPQPLIGDDAGKILRGTDHGIHRGARTG